jgi:hypothetical protein
VTWISLAFITATGGGLAWYYQQEKERLESKGKEKLMLG